jgi:hypothetical protein
VHHPDSADDGLLTLLYIAWIDDQAQHHVVTLATHADLQKLSKPVTAEVVALHFLKQLAHPRSKVLRLLDSYQIARAIADNLSDRFN